MSVARRRAGPVAPLRRRLAMIYALLAAGNLAAWGWALIAFRGQPLLLGTALLAYTFGLRHAVDADHIAAIDNVTRKLRQLRQRPAAVGLFFALGHSAVVILATLAIALSADAMAGAFGAFRNAGGVVGTLISASFLVLVAAMNLVILGAIWRQYRAVRRGGAADDADLDLLLNSRGLLARLFRPLFRLVSASWHMFPLGFLFGLGFDTATEISLLGLSATQTARGLPTWSILVFPALFAAGMTLVDTTDGVLMLGAYEWAYVSPLRKLTYNLAITLVSVAVAVLVGGVEILGLLAGRYGLSGWFWDGVSTVNDHFGALGFAIVGAFIAAWVGSLLLYRYAGAGRARPATPP